MTIYGGLDFETTGLSWEAGHRIIEAALTFHKDDGTEVGSFVTRINPGRSIDPAAEAVTGISLADLVHEPPWERVAAKLSALMGKCDYIVAHNGEGFDIPFVVHEFMRVGVAVPKVRLVDTMLQGRWATPDGMPPNLGQLAWASGVDYDKEKAHAALYDVRVMMECFFKNFRRGFFTLPTREWQPPVRKKAA